MVEDGGAGNVEDRVKLDARVKVEDRVDLEKRMDVEDRIDIEDRPCAFCFVRGLFIIVISEIARRDQLARNGSSPSRYAACARRETRSAFQMALGTGIDGRV